MGVNKQLSNGVIAEYGTFDAKRFKYVFFACKYIYFDAQTNSYVCASNGKKMKSTGHCKRCSNLKTFVQESPTMDLRNLNGCIL